MKKRLNELDSLILLERSTAMYAECLYLINSESSARNLYFTTKRDIKFAHQMINRHLSGIMEVVSYLFTPEGWILIVKTKSEEEILSYLRTKKHLSKKLSSMLEVLDISGIISEHMRKTISSIARQINRYNNRQGVLVKHCFSRYIFETLEAGIAVMRKMKKEEIRLCKQRKRYRPNMKFWDRAGEVLKGDVFLSMGSRVDGEEFNQFLVKLSIQPINVLRNIVKNAFSRHVKRKPPKNNNFSTYPSNP